MTIDLGVDTVRNYQQAGLVAYAGDDDFARLSHVAIWNTRQIEFGRELPYAGRLSYGGMVEGPPAETTWLRLAHRIDPATGEHEFRAATSRDGRRWDVGRRVDLPGRPGAAHRPDLPRRRQPAGHGGCSTTSGSTGADPAWPGAGVACPGPATVAPVQRWYRFIPPARNGSAGDSPR